MGRSCDRGGVDCNPAAAAIGRVAQAHTVILAGEVRRGLDLVEEAAVATISGELDAISTGMVYCELVCMLQGLAQYDLAEEWTEAMERWRHGSVSAASTAAAASTVPRSFGCAGRTPRRNRRPSRLVRNCDPICAGNWAGPSPNWARYDSSRAISKVRKTRFSRPEAGWDPEPGLALLRLAQGDVALAAASIRDALDHPLNVPSKELPPNTDLRRAPLLAAQVEIDVAAGDLIGARDAADELARVAAAFESRALAASAAMADGRVRLAARRHGGRPAAFETAVQLWSLVGAPHEAALARTGLAQAERTAGAEVDVRLELGPASSPVRSATQVNDGPRESQRLSPVRRLLVHLLRGTHRDTA